MSLLSSPGHFGTLCPKVRERVCDFISPHIPAGRGLPCEQLHTGQIAHEGNNLFPGLSSGFLLWASMGEMIN